MSLSFKFIFNSFFKLVVFNLPSPATCAADTANFINSNSFASSCFSLAVVAFGNNPLSPVSVTIVTPASINSTIMFSMLSMVRL